MVNYNKSACQSLAHQIPKMPMYCLFGLTRICTVFTKKKYRRGEIISATPRRIRIESKLGRCSMQDDGVSSLSSQLPGMCVSLVSG